MDTVMQSNTDIKEKIIATTISLIEDSDGLAENITVREIARKADVAVGLINYHFGSKKNLIEICVQRIISNVIAAFPAVEDSTGKKKSSSKDNSDMAAFVARVFAFLMNNPEISKISMLSDLSQASAESNSSVSYRAILKAIADTKPKKLRKVKAFMLLSTIQSAFLNREISEAVFDIDLQNEDDYRRFFQSVTDILNI